LEREGARVLLGFLVEHLYFSTVSSWLNGKGVRLFELLEHLYFSTVLLV
jgi:hypothetical protein